MVEKLSPYLRGKKHVIWDWNGTLLNDVELVIQAVAGLLHRHGLPALTKERYREIFCFPIRDYYLRLGFDFDKVSFETLSVEFIEEYERRAPHCELHGGVKESLEELSAAGYVLSVLSAAHEGHLREIVAHFGIDAFFRNIYGLSDYYGHSKIDRGKELIAHSGIDPSQTLLVGDTDHDLQVGKELGIDVVLIADGHQSYERLIAVHPHVLETR